MSPRVILHVDRVMLPHGVTLDRAALATALSAEIAAYLAGSGDFGTGRAVARVGAPMPDPGLPLAAAIARAAMEALKP